MEKIREKSEKFKDKAAVLHWNGKLLPALTGKGKVDRLPILITAEGEEMFLGAPKAESGTGKDEADAVYGILLQWDFFNEVKAFCCDTTASNTGKNDGVCKLLEVAMEDDKILFSCRHHMAEINLRAAFEKKLEQTTGPNVPFFMKIQDSWSTINHMKFQSGMADRLVVKVLRGQLDELLFARGIS